MKKGVVKNHRIPEMKMYSEGAGTVQKYMIPYYYITGNENGNEVEIIMPAIKNEYLKVN